MDGLNRAMLIGNLGADPELRMTKQGQGVLSLSLATSESYLDKEKTRQERTEWHKVVIWGKRGEALAKILHKGDRVFVEGGLRTTKYQDRDGNDRYKTEIVASNVILSGSKGPRPARDDAEPMGGAGESFGDGDDDVPF